MANQPTPLNNVSLNLSVGIVENKCLSFNLTEYGLSNKEKIPLEKFEFGFAVNFAVLELLKQVRITLSIKIFEKNKDNLNVELADLNTSTVFVIQNFDEVFQRQKNTNQFLIPNTLIELFNGIAVSSARGMCSVKLEDTIYSNAILPLIDPKMLSVTPLAPVV